MRDPTRIMAATVLVFEGMVVFFASLVAKDLSSLTTAQSLAGGGVIAVLCVLASGLLGRPGGYVIGSVLQVVILATGFWVTAMFVAGGIFAALWVASLVIGRRLMENLAERQRLAGSAES